MPSNVRKSNFFDRRSCPQDFDAFVTSQEAPQSKSPIVSSERKLQSQCSCHASESNFSEPITTYEEEKSSYGTVEGHRKTRTWRKKALITHTEGWLLLVFIFTLISAFIQLFVGVYAHSLALLSDLSHAFLDTLSYGINYLCERMKRSETMKEQHENQGSLIDTPRSFSKARLLDLVGSGVSMLTLFGCTIFIIKESLRHLHLVHDEEVSSSNNLTKSLFARSINAPKGGALFAFSIVDTVATVVLVVMAVRVSGGQKASSPFKDFLNGSLSALHELINPGCRRYCYHKEKEENMNLIATFIHLVADTLRSIAVLISSIVIWTTNAAMLAVKIDAIAALTIAVLVLLGMAPICIHISKKVKEVFDDVRTFKGMRDPL